MPRAMTLGKKKWRVKGLKVNFIVFEMMYFQQQFIMTIDTIKRRGMKYSSSEFVMKGIINPYETDVNTTGIK